ncbi:MAG: hypothetical protein II762_06385 [Ruminococcus sp.]|nr:hypothetical protein [Ruminococcus sp.]
MSKVDFKLNSAGVRQLLKSAEALDVVKDYAYAIRNRAGDGYEVTWMVGKTRVNASVAAMTPEARRDNYENNTLLKARGGGI